MRNPEAKNRTHADALRSQNIEIVELDVTDSGSVDRAVAAVIANAGRIDVLINNAGVLAAGVSEAFTPRAGHRAVRRQRHRTPSGDPCGTATPSSPEKRA